MESPTSRPDRSRRRSESTVPGRRQRRPSDCDDDVRERRPLSRRVGSISSPIVTVRASADRSRSLNLPGEPSWRIQPEEARAQIITLEGQIERLQMRLLEDRLLENRHDARRERVRAELEAEEPSRNRLRAELIEAESLRREETRRSRIRAELETLRPSPLLFGERTTAPNTATSRPPAGVRLSSNFAEGANGSAHSEDEERRRSIRQRLGELVRDVPPGQTTNPVPLFAISPTLTREPVSPSRPNRGTLIDNARNEAWRHRTIPDVAAAADLDWSESPARTTRDRLWRLENSLHDLEPELEHFPGSAMRTFEIQRSSLTPGRDNGRSSPGRTPPSRATEDAPTPRPTLRPNLRPLRPTEAELARERLRAVWGDFEAEDYVSPITSLFQRSWANAERARRNQEASASTQPDGPIPSLERTPAELIQPDATARVQLQQLQLDLFREAAFVSPRQATERLRQRRRDLQREQQVPTNSLDTQKGRPPPLESEDMKLECECKICFGQIADTLLLPCAHLVVCQWCADQIGAKTKDQMPRHLHSPPVMCPMCRTVVVDRIKVYRG
ncbi:hypothetical protein FN846DRAFT_947080 [Sphaerosporella brunnea]|uniref:RING-type domain-containing protein n=1 Tax=Sphaerosporella brunnea TaxID=1250544 RepID=A0A5J5EYG2_9PEZI|nr:hypothetical protein FN846DRAFT_947080 [Sphaerosporella brunnea]